MLPLLLSLATARAETCGELFVQDALVVRETTNAKGKPTGKTIAKTTSVTGGPDALVATVHSDAFDGKGKPLDAVDFGVTCKGGDLLVDLRAFWPADVSEAYRDFDVQVLASELVFPSALAAGAELPPSKMAMTFTMKDMPMPATTIALTVKDRKVVGPERVETPARAFDAWKITSTYETVTTSIAPITATLDATEWYVPGLGVVKSETWRKGKLLGTTTTIELR